MSTKGVRIRPTPDFFARYLSVGGFGVPNQGGGTPLSHYISLFNDTTVGAFLFVYGIDVSIQFSYWATLRWRQGTLGSQKLACSRINPGLGAPAGQIYLFDLPNQTFLTDLPYATLGNVVGTLPVNTFPLAVVPPGWSLVVGEEGVNSQANQSTTFWYVPMKDQNGVVPV